MGPWWIGRALFFLLMVPGILAWGKEGHYAICKIAEGYLTEDALAAVKRLLPDSAEGDLAAVCSWPDEIRFHLRWSGPLHYVDTPDFKCNYKYCSECLVFCNSTMLVLMKSNSLRLLCGLRFEKLLMMVRSREIGDCHDTAGRKDRCVTGAIYNYTMQLTTSYHDSVLESKCEYLCIMGDTFICQFMISGYILLHPFMMTDNLTEALMFLSHFIGDVHQPLHVGFLGDEGGNTITVRWYHRKTNLHHVWDTMIIDSALKTFYNSDLATMILAIQRNITDDWSNDVLSWETCSSNHTVCPDPYASESISLACKFAYKNATPGSTLSDDYFLSRLPVVEKRLAQSGVRLAATLNRVFASGAKIAVG
ncbi:hypothetical protein FEM48_Zijuj01G0146700 [Ziziphus jujuba var. spinosa]|uniref:Aspergillus nuclease S1 n=1 Tax=Ziziphus jujuba var. spinosa TaxID=714518 RepID=A0A978W1U9_ZIZJJ|nr:hypothetical protein FEM48_Zijuj01G0146700 [Ziziphus jujuba var. spinosa]